MSTLKERLQELQDRWVLAEEVRRSETYREEAARIRRGDRLSWMLLATGFLPLAWQNQQLWPFWLLVAVVAWRAHRSGSWLDVEGANRVALFAACAGFLYFGVTRDKVWAFCIFLVLVCGVLVFKRDLEQEVQRVYLVAFVLFLVFAHLTLEYSFLIGLFLMLISGMLVMLRYHFPEEVRPGRYLAVARVLARPLALGTLIACPIFVLCPRVPVATLNIMTPPHMPGFSDEIHFGEMRNSLESDRLVMTVRTASSHRWRGIAHDFYDGKGWRRGGGRVPQERRADVYGLIQLEPGRTTPTAKLDSAEVITEPSDARYLFSPQFPLVLENDTGQIRSDLARTLIRVEEPQAKRQRYVVWFGPAPVLEQPGHLRKYLQLPPKYPTTVRDLARRVTGGARTPREMAEKIERFLADGEFTYSLDVSPPANRDVVEWFLLQGKSAYCEYFSSAMAVMLRTLDVPTRVVNGYNPGTFDPYAGTWTIRDRNCHSWVEVYLGPKEGWVEFDPTTGRGRIDPVGLADRLGLSQLRAWRFLAGLVGRVDFEWQRYVVSFSTSMQSQLLKDVWKFLEDTELSLRVWWNRVNLRKPAARIAVVAAIVLPGWLLRRRLRRWLERLMLGLTALARYIRVLLARSRQRRIDREVAFYHDMLDVLEHDNIRKRPTETPWEFAGRVADRVGHLSPPVRTITTLYCEVAYRGRTLVDVEHEKIAAAIAELRRLVLAAAQGGK